MKNTNPLISITGLPKGKHDSLPFLDIKNSVLGQKYDLSIAFVSPTISHKLNKEYRGKDKPTNILSFSNSKTSGEIIICLKEVKKDAPNFDLSEKDFLLLLLIHGMLHLKGMDHGEAMEKKENKFYNIFIKK